MGFFACSVRTGKNCSAGDGGRRKTGPAEGRRSRKEWRALGWLWQRPGESGRNGGQTGPEACRGNGERVEYCGTPRELGKPEGRRQRAGKSGKNDPEGRRAAGRAAEAGSFPDAGLETGAGNGSGAGQRTGVTLRSFFVFLVSRVWVQD